MPLAQANGEALTTTPQKPQYMYKRDFHSAMRFVTPDHILSLVTGSLCACADPGVSLHSQNVNHFIMKSLTGWLLHPSIPPNANAAVADVGCGTAYALHLLTLL